MHVYGTCTCEHLQKCVQPGLGSARWSTSTSLLNASVALTEQLRACSSASTYLHDQGVHDLILATTGLRHLMQA